MVAWVLKSRNVIRCPGSIRFDTTLPTGNLHVWAKTWRGSALVTPPPFAPRFTGDASSSGVEARGAQTAPLWKSDTETGGGPLPWWSAPPSRHGRGGRADLGEGIPVELRLRGFEAASHAAHALVRPLMRPIDRVKTCIEGQSSATAQDKGSLPDPRRTGLRYSGGERRCVRFRRQDAKISSCLATVVRVPHVGCDPEMLLHFVTAITNRSGQCKAHIYLRYRSSTRRLAIMTSSFIHNHPQEEGASLHTRICVTERLGKQDRLAPRRKGARSSKALLSVLPHAGQFPGGGRGAFSGHGPGLSLSSHSPPETTLSTPSASPPVPLDLRASRVPGGMLSGNPFLSGLPFLLPGAGHLSAQEAFLQRLIQTQGGLSGGISGVGGIQLPTSPSPSEIFAHMGTSSSPLHGNGILPPFSSDSLLGKRLSPFRPFGTHATLSPEEAVGTSRAFSPSSLPPNLQSHFSSIVQNGITPPGSVSNASSTNQVAGGLLEPECVLRTSESKRLRLSPCGSDSSLTLTGGGAAPVDASNGHVADASGSADLPLRLFGSGQRAETDDDSSPRSAGGGRDDEATMMSGLAGSVTNQGGSLIQDLSTKAGSRRASGTSTPIEVPASPLASAPATPRTSSSSPAPLDEAGETTLMDQGQPVSIIVRNGASEYELRWEELEPLFKLCAKCGGCVDDTADDAHGSCSIN
ncbi:hypothetical protein BIW11_12406, partial [Tropilaelaps mercedesae]